MGDAGEADLNPLDLGGAETGRVLRATDKSVVSTGRLRGRPVVVKVLGTAEERWRLRFRHEIELYRRFTVHPPPVRVPALLHTDGHRVLVVEHLHGRVVGTERCPDDPLDPATLDAVLDAVTAFSRWAPPPGVLAPVFDHPARVDRYHRDGFLDDSEHAVLRGLLERLPAPDRPNHGDPLPSNLLMTAGDGRCALLDFEFTGLFLPGFDLAMLHTLLAATPGARLRITELVERDGIAEPFAVNLALVVLRELRMLGPGPHARRARLDAAWQAARVRLLAAR